MKQKAYLKSKTMRSLIILVVIVVMNILGFGEAEPGKTYDTMLDMEGRSSEQAKNLLLLGAAGGAAYGRVKADTKLTRRKNVKNEDED